MVEIKPRIKIKHTQAEYEEYQRVVGGLTWGAIKVDGTPASREALLNAVKAKDKSKTPSPKTAETLFKWISENLWEKPAEKYEAPQAAKTRLNLPKGYRVYNTKTKGLMIRGKHYKHAIRITLFEARVRGGKESAARREAKARFLRDM